MLNDTVVPNNSTDRLIAAGGLRKLKTLGPNAVGAGTGAYTFFTKGSHGTLFDPTASLAGDHGDAGAERCCFAATAGSRAARSCVPHGPDGARPELTHLRLA